MSRSQKTLKALYNEPGIFFNEKMIEVSLSLHTDFVFCENQKSCKILMIGFDTGIQYLQSIHVRCFSACNRRGIGPMFL